METDLVVKGQEEQTLQRVDLLATFLKRYDAPSTVEAYRDDLEQLFGLDSVFVNDARDISFVDINNHIEEMQKDGLKGITIKRKISAIRGFFNWLEALEVIDRNPTQKELLRKVRTSSGRSRKIVFLGREETNRLLEAARANEQTGPRDYALILTLLLCVLRRSEAAGMNVEDLRTLGEFHVLDLPTTKGGNDQFVKVPGKAVTAIRNMQEHYGIEEGPLWRSLSNRNKGERITPNAIYKIVTRHAEAAGIDKTVGAHTLRHTGCTLAIEQGATVQQVQAHARHKNLQTTMNYVHQADKLGNSAADSIADGIG